MKREGELAMCQTPRKAQLDWFCLECTNTRLGKEMRRNPLMGLSSTNDLMETSM
jgi:hypothetical protein